MQRQLSAGMGSESTTLGNLARNHAAQQIGHVLDAPPALVPAVLRGDTRLTRRWAHGAGHFGLPGMSGHVVMTYYGDAHDLLWRSDGERFTGKTQPGAITVIPEDRDGHWDICGPIEVSHVYLTEERLQSCADVLAGGQRVELLGRVGFEDPAAARILALLSQEETLNDPSARLFVEQAVDLLCTQLVRAHSSFGALPRIPKRGLANWQIRRVTDYMRVHIAEEIGLAELAALVDLSRFHFCTAFRLAVGRTPYEWLQLLRIQEARRMLENPELRITDIALAVGYQSPSAFTAAFRKIVGATPRDYRRQL